MKVKKLIWFAYACVLVLCSCEKDIIEIKDEKQPNTSVNSRTIEELDLNHSERLKLRFGRAFARAISEHPELRQFIKNEALKRFNGDYDIMYNLIKDKPMSTRVMMKNANAAATNNTIATIIKNYFEDPSELKQIESQLPLLTIFVPELPEDSFSAKSWDPYDPEQIPVVGIRLTSTNEVPMIDIPHEHEYVLEADLIPGYPVIVIKDNERLVVDTKNHNFLNSTEVLQGATGVSYRFIDDNFNPNIRSNINRPVLELPDPDGGGGGGGGGGPAPCSPGFTFEPGRQNNVAQFLKDAYNIFDEIDRPWQRDNIYYQLTPRLTTNDYVGGSYREAITYFRLQGNPEDVFTIMSDQSNPANNDPTRVDHGHERDKYVPWTDGFFEMSISITDNSKTNPTINSTTGFTARPEELFTYTQSSITRWRGVWPIRWKRTYWKPVINGFKGMDFTSVALGDPQMNLNPWDLTEFSNIWKYEVIELDITTQVESKISNRKKYNTNIEFNPSIPLGDKTKIGLKFGASAEEEDTQERTFSWVEDSDELGEFNVFFGDAVLFKNRCDQMLYPRLYSNQFITMEIRPRQVEF